MLPPTMPLLLARLMGRRRRTVRALEPADMGTAFGMEQCLGERDPSPQRKPKPAAGAAKRRWLPRWMRGATAR